MLLLVIWVAALQIMLDEGKDLGLVLLDGDPRPRHHGRDRFPAFLIWELTEEYPIVDLRVFRHRGFSSCMLVLALAFGAFFGLNVLTPQWLQYNMGYTTTWAGTRGGLGRRALGRFLPDRRQSRRTESMPAHPDLHRLPLARARHVLAGLSPPPI